ncbi:MAG TPA: triose-phosphate isomerase, partial [Patescibacteria group bacterium]
MKKIIIGNLKMNLLNVQERERYFKLFDKEPAEKIFSDIEIVLCPPFVHLEAFKKWKNKKIKLGAQNMFSESKGSYTGEISPTMLKAFECEYVILGHSERRRYLAENNHEINLKVLAALKNGLTPIICVGENKGQEMATVISDQLHNCLVGVSRGKIENAIICYEPVWAISSNNPDHLPTANEIMSAKLLIRKILV